MTHPTLPPSAILGYRRDGRPIHPIAGGSTPAPPPPAGDPVPAPAAPDPAPQPPTPTPAPTPAEPAAPQQPAPGQEPAPAAPQASAVDELPPWAQRELKKLREEAASSRVRANETAERLTAFEQQQAAQREAFARALGLAPEEPPTPEQLAEQLTQTQAERQAAEARARQSAVELAVFRQAATAGADGNALLDSRAFVSALEGLDPSAADFGQRVTEAITAAVDTNPRYKLAPQTPPPPAPPAIPKSGPEFGAPPQGPRQWTDEDVARATPAELQQAINDGLCENLGFGRRRSARR